MTRESIRKADEEGEVLRLSSRLLLPCYLNEILFQAKPLLYWTTNLTAVEHPKGVYLYIQQPLLAAAIMHVHSHQTPI